MPYVRETFSTGDKTVNVNWVAPNGAHFSSSVPMGEVLRKYQNGYRSGPITRSEMEKLHELSKSGNHAKKKALLNALDRIERATSPAPRTRYSGTVNHREYEETKRSIVNFPIKTRSNLSPEYAFGTGAGQSFIRSTNLSSRSSDDAWEISDDDYNLASSLIRSSAPNQPHMNLARFIGELRDAPRMAQLTNYGPKTISDAGGSYLNYQFGVSPTKDDLMKLSEAVLESDKLYDKYAMESAVTVRRSRHKIIDQSSNSGHINLRLGRHQSASTGIPELGLNAHFTGSASGTANAIGPLVRSTYTYTKTLRAGCIFEYYAGDPYRYQDNKASYKQKAEAILGGGLTPSTALDLTPWSWLVSWFYDINSIVRYQENAAKNNYVSRLGYVTVTYKHSGLVTLNTSTGHGSTPALRRRGTWVSALLPSSFERSIRRPSGAFDVRPSANLDSFQTSILGALGASKVPGKLPWP